MAEEQVRAIFLVSLERIERKGVKYLFNALADEIDDLLIGKDVEDAIARENKELVARREYLVVDMGTTDDVIFVVVITHTSRDGDDTQYTIAKDDASLVLYTNSFILVAGLVVLGDGKEKNRNT